MVMVANKLTYIKLNVALIVIMVTVTFIATQTLFLMQQNGIENKYLIEVYRVYFN